jgi:hypothetical protein
MRRQYFDNEEEAENANAMVMAMAPKVAVESSVTVPEINLI